MWKTKINSGIQKDVGYGAQEHRHHADGPEALGVDKAVHAQAGHHKDISQEVDGDVGVRIADGGVAGPEEVEHGPLHRQPQHCQRMTPTSTMSTKELPMMASASFTFPRPALDGAERGAAHAEEVGKGTPPWR